MMDIGVLDVALVQPGRYTGVMPIPRNPDIISASKAMEMLGIRSKPAFYKLVRDLRAEGVELQHYSHPRQVRAHYLRSEIEAYLRGDLPKPSSS